MTDTSAMALDLIFSGVLDRSPGLTVVAPHLGGVVPYLTGRLSNVARATGLERPLAEYLRDHYYVDTGNTTPGALAMAAATYGAERILFAADYRWVPRAMTFDYLSAELEETALGALLHNNTLSGLIPQAKPIAVTTLPPHGSPAE